MRSMKRSEIIFGLLRIPLDAAVAIGALLGAYRLREANIDLVPNMQIITLPSNLPPFEYYWMNFALPATIGFVLLAAMLRLYSLKITFGPWKEMGRVLIAALLWVALIMAWFFLVQRQLFFSRILLVHATVILTFFAILGRMCMLLLQRQFLKRGIGTRHVLSCGKLGLHEHILRQMESDVRYHYLGHVKNKSDAADKHRRTGIDLMLHTDPNPAEEDALDLISYCRNRQISYAYVPPIFADVPHQIRVERLGLMPVLRFQPTPLDGWGRVWKRVIDVVLGTILFIVTLPLFIVIALLILLTCGRPIFYVSTRVGQYGKQRIPLLKFRTMSVDADARKGELTALSHRRDGPLFKIKNDPRVTPIGRFLRRFTLDEIPQFLNVMAGHLSLVGPRPHLPSEVERYDDHHRRVFTIRPGVTGLSQISGRSDLGFEEEVRLDMSYIEEWSIGLDLWIVWRTFFVVLFGGGAD